MSLAIKKYVCMKEQNMSNSFAQCQSLQLTGQYINEKIIICDCNRTVFCAHYELVIQLYENNSSFVHDSVSAYKQFIFFKTH